MMTQLDKRRHLNFFNLGTISLLGVYAKVMVCQGIQGKMLKTKRTESLDQRESFNESFTFSKIGDPSNIHVRIVITQPGFFGKFIVPFSINLICLVDIAI